MAILRRLRAPAAVGTLPRRPEPVERRSVHRRTSDALEAWADRYGDAFIPGPDGTGERDAGTVRGLRSGVPFELRGLLPARDGETLALELQVSVLGSTRSAGFRRRAATAGGATGFDALFSGDTARLGPEARDALVLVAHHASQIRLEHACLVLRTDAPAPPAGDDGGAVFDERALDALLEVAVDAVRSLSA